MYYTVIKHSGHLRTLEKCRKHSPAARVFYISLVFSNACRVLSQCNTRLRLLYLLNKIHLKLIEAINKRILKAYGCFTRIWSSWVWLVPFNSLTPLYPTYLVRRNPTQTLARVQAQKSQDQFYACTRIAQRIFPHTENPPLSHCGTFL